MKRTDEGAKGNLSFMFVYFICLLFQIFLTFVNSSEDILSEQMNQCFSPSFLPKLKSGDFNDHLFILQRLFDTSAEQRMELLQSLDVVLKWLSLRIMDGNPRVLLRSSEYLERIFELLTASEFVIDIRFFLLVQSTRSKSVFSCI